MNEIKKVLFCTLSLLSALNVAATEQQNVQDAPHDGEVIVVNCMGHELVALDDRYTHDIAAQRKNGNEEMALIFEDVQHVVRTISCGLLSQSTGQEAKDNLAILQQRTIKKENSSDVDWMNYAGANNFEGYELLCIDGTLLNACQEAINTQDGEALLNLLFLRGSTLHASIQLLLPSTNTKVAAVKECLFQRLVECKQLQKHILDRIAESQEEQHVQNNDL
jgi:hypothetical protein